MCDHWPWSWLPTPLTYPIQVLPGGHEAVTLQGTERDSHPGYSLSTKLASSCFDGTKVAPGIVLPGPRNNGASVRDRPQLFSMSRQGIHLRRHQLPWEGNARRKGSLPTNSHKQRGKKGHFHSDLHVGREEKQTSGLGSEWKAGHLGGCAGLQAQALWDVDSILSSAFLSGEPSPSLITQRPR